MENDLDFEKLIQEEVQKALAAQKPNSGGAGGEVVNPTPQSSERPIKINIDGMDYTFANENELALSLSEFRKQALAEIEKAKNPSTQATQPAATGAGSSGSDAPIVNMDRFAELMKEGKVVEAFDYVDSVRYYGGKVDKPAQAIMQQLKEVEQMKQLMVVEAFRQQHPEFPINDPQATQFLENVRGQIGAGFNAQGLEAAYYVAVNKYPQYKEYVESKKPQPAFTQPIPSTQNVGPQLVNRPPSNNPYLNAPPSINRTSANPSDSNMGGVYDDVEKLSAEQIGAMIERMANR
jgi:uncharacterized protein (DUF2164 family)